MPPATSCRAPSSPPGTPTPGVRRETTSDAAGTFLLAGLTPGVYSLGADVSGFRPFSKDGLRLTVGETADVTITLGLANVQESVEVTAGAVTVAVSREGRLSDTFGRDRGAEPAAAAARRLPAAAHERRRRLHPGRGQLDQALELAGHHRQRQPLSRQQLRARRRDEHQPEQHRRAGHRADRSRRSRRCRSRR